MVIESSDVTPQRPAPFEVDEARRDGAVILTLRGEFDIYAAPLVQGHLVRALAEDVNEVECNFEHVSFMDSTGLSVLISAHKRAVVAGVRLVLSSLPPRVDRLLDISGVKEYLTLARRPDSQAGFVPQRVG